LSPKGFGKVARITSPDFIMKIHSSLPSAKTKEGAPFGFLNRWVVLQAFLVIGAVLWIYWPSMHGTWIGDDVWYISTNPLLRDPWRLWKAWFEPGSWVEFYPIEESVQWFQWLLWHNNTFGYHLTNVVLHIVSAFLVWRLLGKFGLRLAWLGALLFAVHPEAVDSVSEMVELKNTLSLPPFILAMCLYMDYVETQSRRSYLWAIALFLVAMLCKITMMLFPFIILLYVWWKRGGITWNDVKASLPFFLISLALGMTTIWSGQAYSHPIRNWDPGEAPLGGALFRLVLSGQVIAFYFSRFFLPINPLAIYAKWPVDPSQWVGFLPWPMIGLVIGCLWSKRRSWGRHALLGLGFFLINLFPFVGFHPISYMNYTWVLDHMLYIPMIGLIGLVAAACEKIDDQLPAAVRPWSICGLSLVLVLLTFQSHLYAGQFVSEEALARYNLRFVDNVELHNNLGVALLHRGADAEALQEFQLASRCNPHDAKVHFNTADVLLKTGRISEAVEAYYQSVADAPDKGEAHAALADTLFQAGRVPESVAQYREAIRLKFEVVMMYGRLGEGLFLEGKTAEGLQQFQRAVELEPDSSLAQYNLAKGLCKTGQVDAGIKRYRQAIRLNPDYAEAHNNLGIVLFRRGQVDQALEEFHRAVQANPNLPGVRNNLQLAEKSRATAP
jgi:tetratricopeptide (TPR) repeat protein